MARPIPPQCVELVKEFEGLRLEAYRDIVGVPTIGYGRTVNVRMGDVITKELAEKFLMEDLGVYGRCVEEAVKVPLNDNQFSALVSFTYNVGCSAFESSTLLRLLNLGEYSQVPDQLRRWNKAGGRVVNGLVRRREAEVNLWLAEEQDDQELLAAFLDLEEAFKTFASILRKRGIL